MNFQLVWKCGEGYHQGAAMYMEFESESLDKAEQFALGVCRLKTWNGQPFKVLKATLYLLKFLRAEPIWEWHR